MLRTGKNTYTKNVPRTNNIFMKKKSENNQSVVHANWWERLGFSALKK